MGWDELAAAARAVLRPRRISEFVEVGGVAAAILTERGNVYVGICIDSACSLGMCAERNAAARMLTEGESVLSRLVCLDWDGRFLPPCGTCREFLMELDPKNAELEFMLSGVSGQRQKYGKIIITESVLHQFPHFRKTPDGAAPSMVAPGHLPETDRALHAKTEKCLQKTYY